MLVQFTIAIGQLTNYLLVYEPVDCLSFGLCLRLCYLYTIFFPLLITIEALTPYILYHTLRSTI